MVVLVVLVLIVWLIGLVLVERKVAVLRILPILSIIVSVLPIIVSVLSILTVIVPILSVLPIVVAVLSILRDLPTRESTRQKIKAKRVFSGRGEHGWIRKQCIIALIRVLEYELIDIVRVVDVHVVVVHSRR